MIALALLAAALVAGDYSPLLVGFDEASGKVTGYYQNATSGGNFSCIFYLEGTLKGSDAPVTTYFPKTPKETIAGTLLVKGAKTVAVSLEENHGGCWNVENFAIQAAPATFSLEKAHAWKSVRVVKGKAYFHDAPDKAKKRKAYVVEGDGVGVLETKPGWAKVEYLGAKGKVVAGWIAETDLFAP